MTTTEVQELEDKLNDGKNKKAKLEGSMESITTQWKEKYGFDTVKEAGEHVKTLDAKTAKLEKKEEGLVAELNKIVDWE